MRAVNRTYNFSAGPAAMPTEVLQQAQAELLDFKGTGMSVMEMSHRGAVFMEVAREVEHDFRELLNVPENYKVLFLQGGGKGEFSLVPLNLLRGKSCGLCEYGALVYRRDQRGGQVLRSRDDCIK